MIDETNILEIIRSHILDNCDKCGGTQPNKTKAIILDDEHYEMFKHCIDYRRVGNNEDFDDPNLQLKFMGLPVYRKSQVVWTVAT